MPDAFVRAVVHIDEQRFPVLREGVVVNGISVVLAGDEAFLRPDFTYRLVVAAVSVFELVNRCSCRLCEKLVSHADTENRLVGLCHGLAQNLHGSITIVRVARTVGDEKAVVIH